MNYAQEKEFEEPLYDIKTVHIWVDGSAFDPDNAGCTEKRGAGIVMKSGQERSEYSVELGNGPHREIEWLAMVAALRLIYRPDQTRVILHTDVEIAPQIIGGEIAMKKPPSGLEEIQQIAADCVDFRVIYEPPDRRCKNYSLCHQLAQWAALGRQCHSQATRLQWCAV